MKIQFNFPNGYAAEITQAREDNIFEDWVNRKFGNRIRDLISEDFILDIRDNSFIANFVYEDDGFAFLKIFGGRDVE